MRRKAPESIRKQRIADNKKRYEEANPEKVKHAKKAWFDAHPDYLNGYYVRNRLKYMVAMAKRRSLKSGVPFSIKEGDLHIPEICPALGIPIRIDARGGFNPNSPSLDRLIPELGYVAGNVRVISNRANLLKRDGTLEELQLLVAYVERELVQCQ